MLLDFSEIYHKYNLKIKGILHIGAHYGQEFSIYERFNIQNLIFFEPLPTTFEILKNNLKGKKATLVNVALGNDTKKVNMYVETANQGQSSSVLQPLLHMGQYPHIKFTGQIEVDMVKLDDYLTNKQDYNCINIDVQGYELEVFKGATETLDTIDYIFTEINRADLYKNCVKEKELDEFLSNYNFVRVETNWEGRTWGDAFYIKKHLLNG